MQETLPLGRPFVGLEGACYGDGVSACVRESREGDGTYLRKMYLRT